MLYKIEYLPSKPSNSKKIEVFDIKNNNTTTYNSTGEAARSLNIRRSVITLYLIRNQVKPYKGIYTFKEI